ncbi:MAG: hypothetical protein U0640_01425 [Phycisphaerales bacterium]
MFMLAQGPGTTTTDIAVMLVAVAVCVVLAFIIVRWWRRFDRDDEGPEYCPDGFEEIYAMASRNASDIAGAYAELPNPIVSVEFHTYTRAGVLGVRQESHRQTLPALEALELVNLLHSYNLRNCLLPYKGSVYVPLLSFLEARKVRRRIRDLMKVGQVSQDKTR